MQDLRKIALTARRSLSKKVRADASEVICKKVVASQNFQASNIIGCYLPMRDEVDTRLIIERAWRANKRIFVPIVRNNENMLFREMRPNTTLVQSNMSIWEPETGAIASPQQLQMVITPLVAFDDSRQRIGMGGGYYDRHFSFLRHRKVWVKPKLVGVAFECQRVEKITPNPWDIRLFKILSESS